MNRMRTAVITAALPLGLAFGLPASADHPDDHPQGKHGADKTVVEDCDGGTVTYDGPEWMWPPNHKYRDLTVTAQADDSSDNVELATEGTHDEYADPDSHTDEMNGSGNTGDDISPFADADSGTGTAQTQHSVRSERSGRGDGRTYTLTYEAQFGDGEPCVGEFTLEVPHDMGNGAQNKHVHEPGG